jgi:hypothetical protein
MNNLGICSSPEPGMLGLLLPKSLSPSSRFLLSGLYAIIFSKFKNAPSPPNSAKNCQETSSGKNLILFLFGRFTCTAALLLLGSPFRCNYWKPGCTRVVQATLEVIRNCVSHKQDRMQRKVSSSYQKNRTRHRSFCLWDKSFPPCPSQSVFTNRRSTKVSKSAFCPSRQNSFSRTANIWCFASGSIPTQV